MKKLILAFSTVALALSSCSKSDSEQSAVVNTSLILPTRILTNYTNYIPNGSGSLIYHLSRDLNITYSGNKIVKIVNYTTTSQGPNVSEELYFYTGDLITKIEKHFEGSASLSYRKIFKYNSNNRLIEYRNQNIENNSESIFLYNYNADGTVTKKQYFSTTISTVIPTGTPVVEHINTFNSGELVKSYNVYISGNQYRYFRYDNKNNPFKNIVGFNELQSTEFADDLMIFGFGKNHNIMDQADNNAFNNSSLYATYTYNGDNFPVTSTIHAKGNMVIQGSIPERIANTQYFY